MAEPCLHQHFDARVDVTRILPDDTSDPETARPQQYHADVRVWCRDCGRPFEFLGLPMGLLPDTATVSADLREARLPVAPAGEQVSPSPLGYRITVQGVDAAQAGQA